MRTCDDADHHPPRRRARAALTVALGAIVALTAAGCAAGGDVDGASGADPAASADPALFALLPADIQESKVISFGALWETPPIIGIDPSDTTVPVGIAPEVADEIAAVLGVRAQWQNLQWPAQLPGVQSGNVDVLFGQVSITAEREQSVVDLIPFWQGTMSLLVHAGITSLADACGKSVGAPVGSIQSEVIKSASDRYCVAEGEPAIALSEYQGASAAISAIQAGTIDAWLDDAASQVSTVAANDAFAIVDLPAEQLDGFDSGMLGLAVGKSQPGLTEALAGALKALIDSGACGEILDAYGLSGNALTVDEIVVNPMTGTPVGESAAG